MAFQGLFTVLFDKQTSVHPTKVTLTASQDIIEFSEEMKPGQLTRQSKQAISKPGHVNNLGHWFVSLKVNCCYKTTLLIRHPIKIVCKAICKRVLGGNEQSRKLTLPNIAQDC